MLRSIFIVCLCVLLGLPSAAQQILFGNYSVGEGLPSPTVFAIAQDDQGYMWFGTKNGLSRFDGYQFRTFRFNKAQAGSLGNNVVHCITKYDSTHLWIGTDNGVYVLDLERELFTRFKPAIGGAVSHIFKDRDGFVWIATTFSGLYRYEPAKDLLHNFTVTSTPSISSNQVSKLIQDDDGRIWIGTLGGGIDIYDPATGRFSNMRSGMSGLSSDVVITIYKGLDGIIWAGTLNGGLCRWQKDIKQFRVYRAGTDEYAIKDDIVADGFKVRKADNGKEGCT